MEKKLKKLKKLADDWKEFSLEAHGWDMHNYRKESLEVRCCFADASEPSSVTFGKRFKDKIEVSYFNIIKFDGFSFENIRNLEKTIVDYRNFLNEMKKSLAKISKERREKERKEKIKVLERGIRRLEKQKKILNKK